ncbi:MAG: hypothetical protein QM627_03340 [Luteolibacter sp.]
MAKRLTSSLGPKRGQRNARRTRPSLAEMLSRANRRAHEQANRKMARNRGKSVYAAIAEMASEDDMPSLAWSTRMFRWLIGLVLLPLALVTTWTFFERFSHAAVQGFWQSAEFWYFALGILSMAGWFCSGLGKSFFLYLYVLGHELTHAIFVLLHLGKVTDFHVSTDGGYITTNKTNWLIALSPYFVPFWSVMAAAVYVPLRYFVGFSPKWDLLLYGLLGATWTFHFVWTFWMILRDQPDLKENGTFLSLVVIYLANVLVLVGLMCVARPGPLENLAAFGMDWLKHAAQFGDIVYRSVLELAIRLRSETVL